MRNIQFCHERRYNKDGSLNSKGGRTLVAERITKDEFNAAVPSLNAPGFMLQVGVAECSRKDNYCKKTGRDISKSRMRNYHMFVTAKSSDELQLFNSELGITLIFKLGTESRNPNLVDIV